MEKGILKYKGNEDIFDFYWAYNDFYNRVKNLNYGVGIMSWPFAEELLRRIYNMKKYKGDKYDAILNEDNTKKYIEIKTTININKNKRVTLNSKNKFSLLYWNDLDLEKNEMTIKVFEYKDATNGIPKDEKKNISLQDLKNCIKTEVYKIDEKSIVKISTY
ncbi:hypothetical protein ACRTAL_003236 [Clostridium perfringens]|uniref:hypothetical protein n=1 Tax=Clostridium perfringens TaxID=1502 RepID=UPI001C8885D8|nr:hypothetical protein [Clostridium perfringens]MDG6893887.1 hypothetical protein [Clostridium perfringens]MDM0782245.1 hypothetical protein [Clostridium perfringens]MDM0811966.1 hypothetical protein [Clostridium perfringens]MDM0863742.1 hypothetical protein [Clostridium perfringens]